MRNSGKRAFDDDRGPAMKEYLPCRTCLRTKSTSRREDEDEGCDFERYVARLFANPAARYAFHFLQPFYPY